MGRQAIDLEALGVRLALECEWPTLSPLGSRPAVHDDPDGPAQSLVETGIA